MLGESLLALAALAGQMVVDTAATDGWDTAERGYAQLLGGGDAEQTKQVKQWLEETHKQLADADEADRELIRTALAGRWAGRWADLLEETRTPRLSCGPLLTRVQAALPAERPSEPATRSTPMATRARTQPVPSTPARWPREANSPTRSGRRGTQPAPETSSPFCCP